MPNDEYTRRTLRTRFIALQLIRSIFAVVFILFYNRMFVIQCSLDSLAHVWLSRWIKKVNLCSFRIECELYFTPAILFESSEYIYT